MKKLLSIVLALAVVLGMMTAPVSAEDGTVIATYPITLKTDFYRAGGASTGNLAIENYEAKMTLGGQSHRYLLKEDFIGQNIGVGGTYRIEMDAHLESVTAAGEYTGEVPDTQAVVVNMYDDSTDTEASSNCTTSVATLSTTDTEYTTVSTEFTYSDTFAATPRTAALQIVVGDGQMDESSLNYYPVIKVKEIRLVEVVAPTAPAPSVPKKSYWKPIKTVGFEDCLTDGDIKSKYFSHTSAIFGEGALRTDAETNNKYITITSNNNWRHYCIVDMNNVAKQFFVHQNTHPDFVYQAKIRVSARVKVLATNANDNVEVWMGVKGDATKTNLSLESSNKTTANKEEWTTVSYEFDNPWSGAGCAITVMSSGQNTIHVDDYKVEVLVEENDDTFTFNGNPVARIYRKSATGTEVSSGTVYNTPYVASIDADEIGEDGKVIFAYYENGALASVELKDKTDAVDGKISSSIYVDSLVGAQIKVICLENIETLKPIANAKVLKAQ